MIVVSALSYAINSQKLTKLKFIQTNLSIENTINEEDKKSL